MAQQKLQPPPVYHPLAEQGSASGISKQWMTFFNQAQTTINGQHAFLEDTHANRLTNYQASLYPAGSTFYETDRAVYYIVLGSQWVYLGGTMQANQATLPADLGANDAGFLVRVTDYGHTLQWTGAAWEWGPGDSGSDFIQTFLTGPTGPGWHVCDGSTVNRLNATGTITPVTLPNYTTAAYVKLSTAASAGPNAPSGQTTQVSAGTPAGTVSQPIFTGNLDTTSAVSAGTPSGANSVESADVAVQSGAGTNVAADTHTHTFTGNALPTHTHTLTPDGTVSQPTFTGAAMNAHSHGPGTLDLENTVLAAYYRQ